MSVDALVKSIEDFIDGFNTDATVYKWTEKADEILKKVRRARDVLDSQ